MVPSPDYFPPMAECGKDANGNPLLEDVEQHNILSQMTSAVHDNL
jgi:hypothetical protein